MELCKNKIIITAFLILVNQFLRIGFTRRRSSLYHEKSDGEIKGKKLTGETLGELNHPFMRRPQKEGLITLKVRNVLRSWALLAAFFFGKTLTSQMPRFVVE